MDVQRWKVFLLGCLVVLCLCQTAAEDSSEVCDSSNGQCQTLQSTTNSTLLQVAHAVGCNIDHAEPEVSACVIEELFPSNSEVHAGPGEDWGLESTYGEVTLLGGRILASEIGTIYGHGLTSDDVFLDAGSGVGKLPTQFFLEHQVSRSYGIEMHTGRCESARAAVKKLADIFGTSLTDLPRLPNNIKNTASGMLKLEERGREIGLFCGDMLGLASEDTPLQLSDVTILLTNSLCFPEGVMLPFQRMLMHNLQPGALVFSSKEFNGCSRGLVGLGLMKMLNSGSIPSLFHVYIVAPQIGAPVKIFSATSKDVFTEPVTWTDDEGGSHEIRGDVFTRLAWSFKKLQLSEQDRFASHRISGKDGSLFLCILSDLAFRLKTTNTSSAWMELMRDEGEYPISFRTLLGLESNKPGNTLYQFAVALRSRSLLRALVNGNAPDGLHESGVGGKTLCHREMGNSAIKDGFGWSLIGLLKELDGRGGTLSPPGSLLPFLIDELGISCSSLDSQGRLPIHDAAQNGDHHSVSMLLNISSDLPLNGVSHADQEGSTPIHVVEQSAETMLLLLEHRAEINSLDDKSRTAFYVQAERAATSPLRAHLTRELVKILAEHRANVNTVGPRGRTPLHVAVGAMHLPHDSYILSELLLELRADTQARDSMSHIPLDYVRNETLAALLRGNAS